MTSLTDQSTRVFRVDAEHGALRLAILVAFAISWGLAFIVVSAIVPGQGLNLLAILLSFVAAYVISLLLERTLKGRWHSGRVVEIDTNGVRMTEKGTVQEEMRADQNVKVLLWRFDINKRARVPKGWSMLACALQDDDRFLPVYTFMSPSMLEQYEQRDRFKRLASKKDKPAAATQSLREDASSSLRLAGEQRRLAEAEQHRWMHGAEMTVDDFKAYLSLISNLHVEWTFDS
jgi:hypothetical protein